MKKITSILLALLIFSNSLISQKVDLVVDKEIYKSYFSKVLKVPLFVEYKLYQGGGKASRKGMKFREGMGTAKNRDYSKSGFDKGHLVPAEDFAYDIDKENLTFSFYNCFPQSPKLNRGAWKSWESTIRAESQKWPLKIYTGGIFGSNKLKHKVGIPDYCWKVVFNQKTGRLMHVLLFKNDETEAVQRVTIGQLKLLLGYSVPF
jgi:endonuclease G